MSSRESLLIGVRRSLDALLTPELTIPLFEEYQQVHRRFVDRDWRPAELTGARYCEAAIRGCQKVALGKFTPVKNRLPGLDGVIKELERSPKGCDDTFRIHIPRFIRSIYDLRSKRNVAHLGGTVSPNLVDSTVVLSVVNWIMAEFVRVAHSCHPHAAQRAIDALSQRTMPLIWKEGDLLRVLIDDLSVPEEALVILDNLEPDWTPIPVLAVHIQYGNTSRFRTQILPKLEKLRQVVVQNDEVRILPPGKERASRVRELHRS